VAAGAVEDKCLGFLPDLVDHPAGFSGEIVVVKIA
jgi:hypothetical protein